MTAHRREPDGWCMTCSDVKCRTETPKGAANMRQMDRIEAKLNRILRAMNLDPDTGASP